MQHMFCSSCYFIGDAVELMAASKEWPTEKAIEVLTSSGLLHFSDNERQEYLTTIQKRVNCRALVKRGMAHTYPSARTQAVSAVLHSLEAPMRISDLPLFGVHAFPLHINDLLECLKLTKESFKEDAIARETLKFWGLRMAFVVPCWSGIELTGLWVYVKGECQYLPLSLSSQVSVGLGLVPRFTDPYAVVVDDPLVGLRCAMWSVVDQRRPRPFVMIHGVLDDLPSYQCQRLIYWSPSADTFHYTRSLRVPDSRTLSLKTTGSALPCGGSYGMFEQQILRAPQSTIAFGKHLLSLPESEACARAKSLDVVSSTRERVLTHFQGDDYEFLDRVLGQPQKSRTAHLRGQTVQETSQGWLSNGRVISAARIHLERVWVSNNGDALAAGEVVYCRPSGDRISIPFIDQPMEELRRSPGRWVERLVLSRTGYVPFVLAYWRTSLLEIAQQMHPPEVSFEHEDYGWRENTMYLANFTVDAVGVSRAKTSVSGPTIDYPNELDASEWKAFTNTTFSSFVLILLAGMLRSYYGHAPVGVLLVNAPHVLDRLSTVLGSSIAYDPTNEYMSRQSNKPLPVLTRWSEKEAPRLFAEVGISHNVIASVDHHTASAASAISGWLSMDVCEQLHYSALRVIFHMLPLLLESRLDISGTTPYSDIADRLLTCERLPEEHTLVSAGRALDTRIVHSSSVTTGGRMVELMVQAVREQRLSVRERGPCVEVNMLDFMHAFSQQPVRLPSIEDISAALVDARYLAKPVAGRARCWQLDRTAWELHMSLVS